MLEFSVICGARDDSESSGATRIRFSRRSSDIMAVLVAAQAGLPAWNRAPLGLAIATGCWITHVMICEPRRGAVFSERLMHGLVAVLTLSPRRIRGCFVIPATMPAPTRGTIARRFRDKTVRSRARHSIRLPRRSIKVATVCRYSYWRPLFRPCGRSGQYCVISRPHNWKGLRRSLVMAVGCRKIRSAKILVSVGWWFGLTVIGAVRKSRPFCEVR
jgi:hypothetical protein